MSSDDFRGTFREFEHFVKANFMELCLFFAGIFLLCLCDWFFVIFFLPH